MDLTQALVEFGGSAAISQVASRVGIDEATAAKAAAMLLPAISQGLQRNVEKEGGAASLLDALQGGNHARYLDDASLLKEQSTTADGNGILGHVLGNKDASRAVAATVSGALGIENETVQQMLPLVATMAMGALAKQQKPEPAKTAPEDLAGALGKMLTADNAAKVLGGLFG